MGVELGHRLARLQKELAPKDSAATDAELSQFAQLVGQQRVSGAAKDAAVPSKYIPEGQQDAREVATLPPRTRTTACARSTAGKSQMCRSASGGHLRRGLAASPSLERESARKSKKVQEISQRACVPLNVMILLWAMPARGAALRRRKGRCGGPFPRRRIPGESLMICYTRQNRAA